MKKLLVLSMAVAMALGSWAQSKDLVWNIGIEGGGQQYNGSYGDGFYTNKGLSGFGGVSLYRYLSPHFDAGIGATGGGVSYKNDGITDFKSNLYHLNANLRFSFFKYEKVWLRPFLLAGFGDAMLNGTTTLEAPGKTNTNYFSIPDEFGGGVTLKLSQRVNMKLQETFIYPHKYNTNSEPDGYLLHSIGISYNFGSKKDADKDGVVDRNDKCPGTPAGVKVDKKGCPLDRDGDGTPDYLDLCPDVKGPVATKGCPDSDSDGVADNMDKCPNTPRGVAVDANGCPLDRDGDGVPDYLDACPDVKGTAALKGCPDADNDGVADNEDKCPNTPAGVKVDKNGCPLDRDGDGVPDYEDKCPDEKGTAANHGCPEVKKEAKEIFQKALEGIKFQTGKDVIQKSSYPIMNQVVTVMKENPSYNLQINGYTDNVGKPEENKILSEKRANAVKKYLEEHGVDAKRLKASGFGGENPAGDNKTEEGRTKNRRVEFIVNF